MLERLKKMLAAKEERKADLNKQVQKTEDIQELRSINAELGTLNDELAELRSMIADAEAKDAEEKAKEQEDEEFRSEKTVAVEQRDGKLTALGTFKAGAKEERTKDEDPFATIEYRKAFMNYAKTGKMSPELRDGQPPADAFSGTGDVSAVIPTTILDEIIDKVKIYGQVFSRVRRLSIKGGVQVPILSLRPVATWIGEDEVSPRQKVQANTSVTFSFYGLECRIATSLLADTVTLDSFENIVSDLGAEAMVIAIDKAVISGLGGENGQPLGIVNDTRIPSNQKITLDSKEILSWHEWKRKVFAKMPLAYKGGAVFLMASGTFEGYIDGMVDTSGQPVGRVNHGITSGPQERFGGKEVILVEDDIINNWDDAEEGEVVAIYGNLRNYAFNSNLTIRVYHYMDHETNQYVDKLILIADGKILDPNGFIIIRKGEEVNP